MKEGSVVLTIDLELREPGSLKNQDAVKVLTMREAGEVLRHECSA